MPKYAKSSRTLAVKGGTRGKVKRVIDVSTLVPSRFSFREHAAEHKNADGWAYHTGCKYCAYRARKPKE